MSQENVEIVHRLVEEWNRSEVDAVLERLDADCEVVFPPEVPEPGPFRGRAEVRQWVEGFLAAWESHRAEVVEVVESKDKVIAVLHLVGRGVGSGIDLDATNAHVFAFHDGKITRWQNFNDRREALEVVGLSE